MNRRRTRLACALALAAVFAVSSCAVSPVFAISQSSGSAESLLPVAGNYCVSCHDGQDARLARAADWRGSAAMTPSTCPGLQAEDEQLYYLERELLAITRLAPNSVALTPLYAGYATLLDAPRDSTDAFAAQAQLLAYNGGKTYAAVSQDIERGKRLAVLIVGILVTAFLLFALAWGLRNTLRFQPSKRFLRSWRPGVRTVGLLGVVVVLFALPLFRDPAAAVATSTAEDQAIQAELDKSTRAGSVAERSLGRAWMLAQVAATWSSVDPARGSAILDEALAAEAAARAEADALWGRSQAGREAAVGSVGGQGKAALVSDELLSVRNRAWALRLIASEWAPVDITRASEILGQAEAIARANPTIYGQIDLAAIAGTWARLDPGHVVEVPALSLASSAPTSSDPLAAALALYRAGDYGRAWDASLTIGDEWERARGQAAIAVAWGKADAAGKIAVQPLREYAGRRLAGAPAAQLPADTAEALAAIDQMETEAEKAEALRSLAVRTGAQDVFERALRMAAAARVRGDPLAASRASLALAQALMDKGGSAERVKAALAQAYDLTLKISVKYK